MLKKKFFKIYSEKILLKKIFVKNYYEKLFIRNNVLDNGNLFYNNNNNIIQTGFYCYPLKFVYSHIDQNYFTFISLYNKRNLNSINFSSFYYKSLKSLSLNKMKTLIFLTISKGGFKCYFCGLLGFMPIKYIIVLIKKIKNNIINVKFNLLIINFFLINKKFKI